MGESPAAEIDITEELVRGLLAEQHPDLAHLPLRRAGEGWDNAIFRVGDELCMRLPRRALSAPLVLLEQRWLPVLAPHLPLPVPVPVRAGQPSAALDYPWHWSVCPWLPGSPAESTPFADPLDAARQLGELQAALHRPAPADAPFNPYRGVPLAERDERFRQGLEALGDSIDARAALGRWDDLVQTPPWAGPPLWLHGDVHPLNVLVEDGRISAVVDFGDITAGDPASDLAGAWTMFEPDARDAFRVAAGAAIPVDDDTWRRAEAWALALGVAMANGDERVAAFG
ncbi:MAG TPA: aminoglycoside phosphotransferase family protein, partial [Acidimicrobiales bacterium]